MTVYNFEIVDGGLQMQDTGNVSNRYFRYGFEPKKVFDTRVEIWSFDKCIKTLTFDNFGTIGGVTPTDIDNAVELLNALAKQISSGGGGTLPAGASTEFKQDVIIDILNTGVRSKLEDDVIHSSISHTLTETLFSASNTSRTVLRISNETNKKLYIKYKSGITTTAYTFLLSRGDVAVIDDYNGDVYGVWFDNGVGNAVLSETII